MENYIINHLFEFWEHIGNHGKFMNKENGYVFTNPKYKSWPAKVFRINPSIINFEELNTKMKCGALPNSLGIGSNEITETLLSNYNFQQTSIVKGMFKDISGEQKPTNNFATVSRVNTDEKANEFARIASGSFGYLVLSDTIISLVKNSKEIKLFLGKKNNKFVNCGMTFLDKNNVTGIHMIGTLPEYRGFGLGKIMTNKLLLEVHENNSKKVVLVASESGEKIYSKIGFVTKGALKSYSII